MEAAVETGVVKNGDREIFVETYEKNPRLIILVADMFLFR